MGRVGDQGAAAPELRERFVVPDAIDRLDSLHPVGLDRGQRRGVAAKLANRPRPQQPEAELHPTGGALGWIGLAVDQVLHRFRLLGKFRVDAPPLFRRQPRTGDLHQVPRRFRARPLHPSVDFVAVPCGDFKPEIGIHPPGLVKHENPVHRLDLSGKHPVVAVGVPVVRIVGRAAALPVVPVGRGPLAGDQRIDLPALPAAEVRGAERAVAHESQVRPPGIAYKGLAHRLEHHRITLHPAFRHDLAAEWVVAPLAVAIQVPLRNLFQRTVLRPAEIGRLVVRNQQHQGRLGIDRLRPLHRRRADILRRRVLPGLDGAERAQARHALAVRRDHAGPLAFGAVAILLADKHRVPLRAADRDRQLERLEVAE